MTRSVLVGLATAILAASLYRSVAADSDGFQQHYERAVSLYLSERYEESLAEFTAAYSAKQFPRLLINIGQAQRKLGHAREALAAYNAYLKAEASPEPQVRQKVDDYIRLAQAMIDQAAAKPAAAKPAAGAAKPRKPPPVTRFAPMPSGVTADLHAITGRARDDLWAVGDHGVILHYDGKRWEPSYRGFSGELRRIAGSRPDDIWAIGRAGLCLHFDGAAWHVAPSFGETNGAGVWTSGPGDAWVADDTGAVQRLDGTDWVPVGSADLPEGLVVTAAAASAPSGVRWMVGIDGAIARWNGKALDKVLSGARSSLFAVWQSAPDDAWAVGKDGALLHYDGKLWKPVASPTKLALFALWGTGPRDLWAAGGSWDADANGRYQGVILHYDGSAWSVATEAPARMRALWGTGSEVFAAGEDGAIYHRDASGWVETPRRTRETLWDLWGTSARDVWAIGDGGVILHYDGATWSTRWRSTQDAIYGLWEVAPDDVWAVGAGGMILHRTAKGWSSSDSGTTETLRAVWAAATNDVWAAGDDGVVLHWDGAAWSPRKSGVKKALTALWGTGAADVWIGGERTTLLHFDGRTWTAAPSPVPGEYNLPTVASIWGSAANNVWAVGGVWDRSGGNDPQGILLHYDGTAWTMQRSNTRAHLDAITGSGAQSVWAVGGTSQGWDAKRRMYTDEQFPAIVLHYDGKTWRAENASDANLSGVWSSGSEVWAVGDKGAILAVHGK